MSLVRAWLLGRLSTTELQLAHLSGQVDDVTYDTLIRCEGWAADHDRMLLIGNRILTPDVIRDLVRVGRMPRLLGAELLEVAAVVQRAVDDTPRTILRRNDGVPS